MASVLDWLRGKQPGKDEGHEILLPRSLVHVLSEDELQSALERATMYEQVAADRTTAHIRHYKQMMNQQSVVVPMPTREPPARKVIEEDANTASPE